MNDQEDSQAPGIEEMRAHLARIAPMVVRTPVVRCQRLEAELSGDAEVFGKLEFLQRTGTFKPRGALANVLTIDPEGLKRGVTAVSAGNHAIATAYAARAVGTSAKVVMLRSASPIRVESCKEFGADVVFAEDVHEAFQLVEAITAEEGRVFVHPFEGRNVALGTGTIGIEIVDQLGEFDVVIVPIGGGGLCSGISSAVKQLRPNCRVIGVEPEGADSMHRSFASGRPEKLGTVATIADSLGAPFALPYSFSLCQQYVDELVKVSDRELSSAMRWLFLNMKIAVEPACAATTAALLGPLRGRFDGQRVVPVFCGSNIDWPTFARHAGLN